MPSLAGLATSPDTDTPGLREGRACRHCAQVKERCIPHEDSQLDVPICQRCHRLRKKCTTPAPIARKRQRTTVTSTSPPTPAPTPSLTTYQRQNPSIPPVDRQQPISTTLQAFDQSFRQQLLDSFLRDMADYFPFLNHGPLARRHNSADPKIGVAECEEKIPFTLAAALMAALHRHCVVQRRVSQELLATLANALILQGRKSMDLLYCIIILEAWYPFHIIRNPQMMNMLHLARAMIVDLGLAVSTGGLPDRVWGDVSKALFGGNPGPKDTAAECGALMAVYYVAAFFAVTLRRPDFPHWHESLDKACNYFEETSKSAIHVHAIYSMRLLKLAERYLIPGGVRPSETMTVRAYVSCFRSDLQKFRSSLPTSLATSRQFQLDLQCIELALYDRVTTCQSHHHAETVEALHAFLALVSSFFDNFLAIPATEMPLTPSITRGQIALAIEILVKLSTITGVVGWDCNYVRTHVNVPHTIERLIEKFEEVYMKEREQFPDMEASQFAIYPIKLRQRKKRYEEAIAKELQDTLNQAAANGVMGGSSGMGNDSVGAMDGLEAFDEYLQWSYPVEDFSWP